MSFAVVKFLNENENDCDLVQEVPTSWLCKDNKSCKWPPERYVKIYINKQLPPEPHWEEHPVEVEGFFDSMQEAHKRANEGKSHDESLGRGRRLVKPTDYFSPSEELEREAEKKKKFLKKKPIGFEGLEAGNFHESFLQNMMTGRIGEEKPIVVQDALNEVLDIDDNGMVTHIINLQVNSQESPISASEKEKGLTHVLTDKASNQETENGNGCIQDDISIAEDSNKGSFASSSLGFSPICSDVSVTEIHRKLDSILNCLANLKMDMSDLKERHNYEKQEEKGTLQFPVKFPMKSLNELEELDAFLKCDEGTTTHFATMLKSVGGSDFKDFTHRICRFLFSNGLAVLCSWTGRKNNFPIGNLKVTKIMYDVVHQKSKISKKDFENVLMEWFRHARQRKQREEKKDN